jgi:hypothetical protein
VEQINSFLEIIINAYGPWGLGLLGIVLLTLTIQLCFYLGRYAKLPKYKDSRRALIAPAQQPVSLVLSMGEDYLWLENTLPVLLSQVYPTYEIVVVYVGNDTEFAETLQALSAGASTDNCRLTCTQIKQQRFPITLKTAHNVGIKAASYDNIILTTPDMIPSVSRRWLANMAAGFSRGDIVIGYCGVERGRGLSDLFIRTSQMMSSIQSLSSAIKGKAYKASIQNFGFRKQLYFDNKGFGYLNMSLGEDDLFLQRIIRDNNVSVVIGPNSTVRQKRWGGLGWWISTQRQQAVTYANYVKGIRDNLMWEPVSRMLFWISAIAAMAVMPDEVKIAVAVLVVLRYVLVWHTMFGIARRLGEKGVMGFYFIYDLLSPVMDYFMCQPKKS